MKQKIWMLLSFIIPILIFIFSVFLNDYYPFGNKLLLMIDGLKQYPGFIGSIIDIIKNNDSIFYSFSGLLGFNYIPVATYYLLNITNIFVFLFDKVDIINFYSLIITLKFGLIGLTMFIFLDYKNKDNKYNLLFSICYALCSYNLLYYCNYMWFDSIIMLPLVILGIEKIIKENKYIFYIITLFLAIIFNYYIGYMICIFSAIYFIYLYLINNIKSIKYIYKFIFFSIVAGLLCSFILLPTLLELLAGKADLFINYVGEYFKFDFDFLNAFYKLSIASYMNGDFSFGTPNIYVSIFVIVNVCLFFINPKINKKNKIISGIIISFFLLAMSFNFLDYFFHMLQKPIWYPVRYGFIFDFFLITIAYQNFTSKHYFELKKLIICGIVLFSLMVLGSYTAGVYKDIINISPKIIYLAISLIFIIYYMIFINNKNIRRYLLFIIIIELSLNTYLTLKNNSNNNYYSEFNHNINYYNEVINQIDDKSFYRISNDKKVTKNDGLLFGYNDISYFSSVRNSKTINIIENFFKIHTNDNCSVSYYYNNPFANALLAIKYYITKNNIGYYELVRQINNDYLYINKDATGIGFLTNENILKIKTSKSLINNMSSLYNALTKEDKTIINEITYFEKNVKCSDYMCISDNSNDITHIKYKVNKSEEGFYFIQNDFNYSKERTTYEMKINGHITNKDNHNFIYAKNNDQIEINIYPKEIEFRDYDYHVYFVKFKDYLKFVEAINQQQFVITNYYSDSYIKGEVMVNSNNILFTTIPNDKGWEVFVDGQKTQITEILDGLIGIKLEKGKHSIEFIYKTPGLKTGIIISVSSCSILVIYYLLKRKKK